MKLRTGFISNSSSSSYSVSHTKMDGKSFCPYCYDNKEIYLRSEEDGYKAYECRCCNNSFDTPLSLTDIRRLKLGEINVHDGQ